MSTEPGPLPTRVDPPATVLPYLGATGVAGAAMLAGVLVLGLPVSTVATYGLTFLGLGMALKRVEDVPPDHPSALLRWVGDRIERLGEKFGVETYGLVALTTFLHYEVASLSVPAVPLSRLLSDFPANLIVYLVRELIETVMNMVWAGLWWLPLFTGTGWTIALAVIAAAWAVVWVLDMPERVEDYGTGELARDMEQLGREAIDEARHLVDESQRTVERAQGRPESPDE
jgi:hypothetical protein